MTRLGNYLRRQTRNGTPDSICLRCFRTIRTTESRSLAESEFGHICNAVDLDNATLTALTATAATCG